MFPPRPMRREGVCGGFIGRLLTAIVLLIWLPAAPAFALDPGKAITQYIHDVWQTGQGLPQNSVYAICQTRDGYLWLGTQEGLVRFDGVRFAVFDRRNIPELRQNAVRALCEDREGSLWIGTYGGGLSRFRDGMFTSFTTKQGLSNDLVLSLCEGREGSLWIGTDGGGLNRLKDGKFTSFTTKQGLTADRVLELRMDRAGSLWIATYGGGVSILRDGTFISITTQQGLTNGYVGSLCEDREGSLWIGTEGGLHRFRDGKLTAYTMKDGLSNDRIISLCVDRAGSLWIGTAEGGLNRFRDGKFTSFTTKDGLSNEVVVSLYEDREGSLWIGTDGGGLNRFRDGKFTSITMREGLSGEFVVSFCEDREGSLWIGTFGDGLNRLKDGKLTAFTTKQGLSNDQVTSLFQDRAGNLWIATYGGGLNCFRDGKFTSFTMKQGLSNDKVLALYEDREGSLWIGTEGGLNRFRDGEFTAYVMKDGLSNDQVHSICEDREGGLWIGTEGGGLNRFRDGKFTAYVMKDGLSSDQIMSLYGDREGSLWIGTDGGGLNRYRGGQFSSITVKDGLFDDLILQILEDDQGNLWMTCNKGIFRASRKELNEFAEGKVQRISCVSYGIADGMKSAECNGGSQPSCLKTRDGRLWFPTVGGAVAIDPAHPPVNKLPPPVVVEDAMVDEKLLVRAKAGSQIVLPPGKGKLEFHYTALSFLVPQRVKFKYRLEGFDRDWVDAGTERTAHYTNLPPRRYTFRVIACNDDGIWNEAGASFTFRLKPHFYQTIWFYALVGMTVIGALHTLYRRRAQRLLELERVRTRIATDLHDEVGAGLTHIAMINETIHGQLSGSHAVTAGLASTAAGTARELVDSLTDVVWAIDPKLDDIQSLIARIRKFSSEVLEARGINFEMSSPDDLPRVRVGSDHRRQILLIFKEAVNNIAKYAACTAVHLKLDLRARSIEGEIRDDGLGFDTAHVVPHGSGRGLASMRERAERLGGSLTVASEPGKGTRIAFTIPLKPHEHAMPRTRDAR